MKLQSFKIIPLLVPACLALCAPAQAAGPKKAAPSAIVRLEVVPHSVALIGREARQKILINGYRSDGSVVDLTGSAGVSVVDTRVARVDSEDVTRPVKEGKTTLRIRAAGLNTTVPVTVIATQKPFAWSFDNHVEAVFSKQGCNMGACHGAAAGKGGFRLTLRAYDPEVDYARLRLEGRGRRVVKTNPPDSLLLKKPSLNVSHVGGLKLRKDTLEYRVLSEWIAAGAPGPRSGEPRITRLEVYPSDRVLLPRAEQHLLVTALFSDGHAEDVTHWAKYSSNEEPIAHVDDEGLVTMHSAGETAISVWYLGKVAFARVSVPFNPALSSSLIPHPLSLSPIDALVHAKLSKLHLRESSLCTDAEFIRRAFLDTIGTLPTATETRAFLTDTNLEKRNRLIESLLDRPEYVDFWVYKWGDLLRVNRDLVGGKGMSALQSWVRQSVEENKPWDRFAYELVTAGGRADSSGPANFYRMGTKPEEFSETVSQAFLGIRVQCAHCHNHPFEKWTQNDYYRMANFFSRVKKRGADDNEVVFAAASGNVSHPKLGRPLPPAAFDGPSLALDAPGDRREFLAKWMTAPENPYFARAVVNRVWRQYMGRGLVEPVDDMRLTNPASNEPLLAALTQGFIHDGFDLKNLMRSILRSEAYQRSSRTNETNRKDDRFYSRYLPRHLPAEALLDAVCQVTGSPEKFEGLPLGTRAIALPDTRVASLFLDIFGRPQRQVTCECERAGEPNMAQALHFINAATINDKITNKKGFLALLMAAKKTDTEIMDELYMACLSRVPTPSERGAVQRALASALNQSKPNPEPGVIRTQVFGDLLWAIVSGPEFVFNH
jgi:hypothetical protein